jgi:hypothetical protein
VVQIISPDNDTTFSVGQVVDVQFTAGDQAGITLVELYVGRTRVWYNQYPQRPTAISNDSLKWTATAAGNYTLKVLAYDTFQNVSTPDQRNIVIQPKATTPTVQMNYPTQRVVIVAGQNIQIQATINDVVGIQGLDLVERIGGQEFVYTNDPAYHAVPFGWQVGWQSRNTGDHTLFVRARNVNGGVGQSNDFVIGVADDNPPQVQPSYSATMLTQGSDLRVHVEAVDSKGVKEIRLYVDGNVIASWLAQDQSVGQSQVSTDLWWRNVGPVGTHFAHVWAQDTTGLQAQSPDQGIQVVTVTPTPPPVPTSTPVPPTPVPCIPIISSFSADRTTINRGESTVLRWGKVDSADRVEIDNGIGGVGTPGARVVAPQQTTTYTLYAYCGGNVRTAQVTINVIQPPPTPVPQPTPVPTRRNISGSWSATPHSMQLTEALGCPGPVCHVAGNYAMYTGGTPETGQVNGTVNVYTGEVSLTIVIARPGAQPKTFTGTLSADSRHLTGTLSGVGVITFAKE